MSVRVLALGYGLAAGLGILTGPAAAQMPQMVLPPAISGPGVSGPLSEVPPQSAAPVRDAQVPPDATAQLAPAAKPKPAAKPVPTITLTNASTATATEIVVSAGEMTARLDKPLAAKSKASLRLPKLKGCLVSVAASFEGEGQVDVGEFNICKDKSIRFTD